MPPGHVVMQERMVYPAYKDHRDSQDQMAGVVLLVSQEHEASRVFLEM